MHYTDGMTRKELKEVLERVLSWPEERQEEIVRAAESVEYESTNESDPDE